MKSYLVSYINPRTMKSGKIIIGAESEEMAEVAVLMAGLTVARVQDASTLISSRRPGETKHGYAMRYAEAVKGLAAGDQP